MTIGGQTPELDWGEGFRPSQYILGCQKDPKHIRVKTEFCTSSGRHQNPESRQDTNVSE